ncbi:uncharacterized protein RSE6_10835 [Rhynchosporium secalis]|uniref:RNase H type-1 domain-containing protein n=1 Tax=Rhynchosporium secalis TaxID=38038 RepID=A0A1E1MLG4_RHYSE|nr:uncharacterized protein RSE6_10835 [Rhynchosporium secalis]
MDRISKAKHIIKKTNNSNKFKPWPGLHILTEKLGGDTNNNNLSSKKKIQLFQGCESCTVTEARATYNLSHGGRHERRQSERSRIRQELKTTLFEVMIIIQPREAALTEAALAGLDITEHPKAVYWADGSRLKDGSCGIGVVYSTIKSSWTEISYRVRGSANTDVLEVYEIVKALEIA